MRCGCRLDSNEKIFVWCAPPWLVAELSPLCALGHCTVQHRRMSDNGAAEHTALSFFQRTYLNAGAILPLCSCVAYVFFPSGTVQHFGGVASNSAAMWCSITASGDVLFAYLCWWALQCNDRRILKTLVRGHFLYSILHFGSFWRYHLRGTEPHPQPWLYPIALAVSTAALVKWGIPSLPAQAAALVEKSQPPSNLQRAFLAFGAVLAAPSIVMYALRPSGTVAHFGGTPSESADMWCSIQSSGDILMAFVGTWACFSHDTRVTVAAVRASALYTLFHVGGFWYWHSQGTEPHPSGAGVYAFSFALAGAALAAWGRIRK